MYRYETILAELVRETRRVYKNQILDPAHPAHGCFLTPEDWYPSADHVHNAMHLATACYAFLCEGSELEGDDELFGRIQKSIAFERRWQRPSGLIDLVVTNWESPPDTGFAVQGFAPIVEYARRLAATNDRAAEIAETLGEFVRSAAAGMIGRGFHTPNHRWVVCSALAQAMTLYPQIDARAYVESFLAETIDINADGEFTERSAGVYNAVCNRSLRYMADHLGMPELLDHVRSNLELMTHLFHEDGTVVTSLSRRQDRDVPRVVPFGILDSFFDMAHRDGNGQWAAIADALVPVAIARAETSDRKVIPPSWMEPFAQHPEYRTAHLERVAPPDNYSQFYPVSGLWRVRRGKLSATALSGNRCAFALRYGDVDLSSIEFSGTYNNLTNFMADTIEQTPNGVRMVQRGADYTRTRPAGYDLPAGRPVPPGTFYELEKKRERWPLPFMDLILEITEVDGGFDLHYRTEGGLDGPPIEIEFAFEGPGEWETAEQVIRVENGMTSILKSGAGIFRRGDEAISIGPGSAEHRHWKLRKSEPRDDRFRVLVELAAPVDHAMQIRAGEWSLATRSIVTGDTR